MGTNRSTTKRSSANLKEPGRPRYPSPEDFGHRKPSHLAARHTINDRTNPKLSDVSPELFKQIKCMLENSWSLSGIFAALNLRPLSKDIYTQLKRFLGTEKSVRLWPTPATWVFLYTRFHPEGDQINRLKGGLERVYQEMKWIPEAKILVRKKLGKELNIPLQRRFNSAQRNRYYKQVQGYGKYLTKKF